ncbi:MAG: InlB B-repeat-containing protein, partial [Candidatus Ornithomonoglobus sp.]
MKKSKRLMSLFLTACMLISLSAPAFAADSEAETETAVLKLGDYIQMGTYGGEPVTWRVMAFEKISETNEDGIPVINSTDIAYEYTEGYLPLLMTDKIITMKAFDAGYDPDATPSETSSHSKMMDGDAVRNSGSNYWGDSNIRCWLNSDAEAGEVEWTCGFAPVQEYMWLEANGYADEAGFLNSFNAAERKAIVSTSQKTLIDSLYDGTMEEEYAPFDMPTDVYSISKFYELYQYEYNTDTVFLPDMIQIYNVAQAANFLGGSAYLTSPTDYARQQIPDGSDYAYMDYYPYWMRTPQEGTGSNTLVIMPPYSDTESDAVSGEITSVFENASDMGVRPACYIDMAALDMTSSSGTEDSPYTVALPEYTVTYDAAHNGGALRGEDTFAETVSEGTDIIPGNNNVCEKEGYAFVGWNTDPDAEEALTSYEVTGDVTLYAIYVKTVTVNFYTLDSDALMRETINIYNNNTSGTVTFPEEKDNGEWSFIGWTSAKDSSEAEYKANGTVEISENTDYFAVYSHEITITFTVNDESGTEFLPVETQTYYQYMNSSGVTFPVDVTAPSAPQRTGYYFTGWRSQDNYQNLVPADGTISVNESTSFAAEWELAPPEEFKVTYDYATNGGSSASEQEQTVIDNSPADLTPTAVKSGYEFVGWNTDPDAEEALTSYEVTGDVTLYAIFVKTVTVNFYTADSTSLKRESINIYNNNTSGTVTFPEEKDTGEWSFIGWTSAKDSSEAEYKANGTVEISENTDYFAVYSHEITITFTVNDESGTEFLPVETQTYYQYMNSSGVTFPVDVTAPSAPQRTGYYFTGWRSQDNYQNLVPADGTISVNESTSFAAEWELAPPEEFKVTYDYATNGGSSASEQEQTVIDNSPADLTPTAVKSGYEFVGWNTDPDAEEALTSYEVTGDVTLYAIYVKTVTVNFYTLDSDALMRETINIYNNNTSGTVTFPEEKDNGEWSFIGWTSAKDSSEAE